MLFKAALIPLFVQVALTFVLMFGMGFTRKGALQRREVAMGDIALGERNWPARATQFANAYHNQFELPVLYYVLTALALITRQADLLFVIMAWLFVATRIGHALIHTGSNDLKQRSSIFAVGAIILIVMWIVFAVRILLAGIAA